MARYALNKLKMRSPRDPEGLNPREMVVEKPPILYGIRKPKVAKPRIQTHFIDRELDFQLDQFEDHCKNFSICYRCRDLLRCKTILSLFVRFFKRTKPIFQSHEVDLDFFIDVLNRSEIYVHMRHIIHLRDDELIDELVYTLSLMVACDCRFIEYFAELDFAMCLSHAMVLLETTDNRLFTNLLHLFLAFLPFHYLTEDRFVAFCEEQEALFDRLIEMKAPPSAKAEIIFMVMDSPGPLPEDYNDFMVQFVDEDVTNDTLFFKALAIARVVSKDNDFAFLCRDLELLAPIFEYYASGQCEGARYAILDLLLALMKAYGDYTKVARYVNVHDLAMAIGCSDQTMANAGFRVAVMMMPGVLKPLLKEMGQLWILLDAIIVAMKRNAQELVLAAVEMIQLVGKYDSAQLIRFLNQDFNEAIKDLLNSDIEVVQEAVLVFFDYFLSTGEIGLSPLGNYCGELTDAGCKEALKKIYKSEHGVHEHARAVFDKMENIERAHRNRNRPE